MMQPLISVLIPAYNHEKYVKETIASIISQTYQNIELIIVDDGSKDTTWQKIKEMEEECKKRFKRIHFETKEKNEGTCKTLNRLIALAKGEFIYPIASDDMAKSDAVEREVNFLMENKDYVLVVGDSEFINGASKVVGWGNNRDIVDVEKATFKTFGEHQKNNRKDVNFNSEQFGSYESLVKVNYIPNGYLIRKSALMDKVYPFTAKAPLEDFYMMLQLAKAGKFKFIDEILFSYRIHEGNTSKNGEHMGNMANKTLIHEEKIIKRFRNKKWKDIFYSRYIKSEIKFKLGPIELHVEESLLTKKTNYVLYIFNIRILNVITKKKRNNDEIIKILNLIRIPNKKEKVK